MAAPKSATYKLDVKSICDKPFTLDSSDAIFTSPALTVDVYQSSGNTILWTYSDVVTLNLASVCGQPEFSITMADAGGSPIDPLVFTHTPNFNSDTHALIVQTDDVSQVGEHKLRISVWHPSNPDNVGSKDFTV